jgi:hypothetical protein
MMDQISYIQEDIKRRLDTIPKPKNKLLNAIRIGVLLLLLTPGSCVSIGASASWLLSKAGLTDPTAENKKWFSNPDQTEIKDDVLEYAKEMFLPVTANAANNIEAETVFRYRDVIFHLAVYPGKLPDNGKKHYSLSATQNGISFWHEGVWPE